MLTYNITLYFEVNISTRFYRIKYKGRAYSFVACISHLTIDHASLLRRSTVPTPHRETPLSLIHI